ncbi:hypothetical protein PoB_003913800 [Plakobranchus ocellatus]|uniref:Uncharacterized protein n=1 Tax=Plakobranchus ocellatus TaxID=259542 RepID=A0AAV4B0K6_9GAST|nr:hypothetical protein PoB_003913800 [Plakobranchus ocellatus]
MEATGYHSGSGSVYPRHPSERQVTELFTNSQNYTGIPTIEHADRYSSAPSTWHAGDKASATNQITSPSHTGSLAMDNTKMVLFTGESPFALGRHDDRMPLYHRQNERCGDQCVHETPNRGYGQMTVWCGVTTD